MHGLDRLKLERNGRVNQSVSVPGTTVSNSPACFQNHLSTILMTTLQRLSTKPLENLSKISRKSTPPKIRVQNRH
ncbi:hypothetical protein BG842_09210 [Haladaptatus sp. W1]|nr:hypothetical protein BG842_09210 [Haladaptatus sp. W1]